MYQPQSSASGSVVSYRLSLSFSRSHRKTLSPAIGLIGFGRSLAISNRAERNVMTWANAAMIGLDAERPQDGRRLARPRARAMGRRARPPGLRSPPVTMLSHGFAEGLDEATCVRSASEHDTEST